MKQNNKPNTVSRAGYEYLVGYMLGIVLQDLTFQFCVRFLKNPNDPKYPNYRQIEQMDQAARSNPQNIAEGHTAESLKSYIHLAGVAHGSNEELGKDYIDYLRQRNLPIWDKNHHSLNTPSLPNDPTEAANMLLTFCQMEGYLLDKLISSLKEKHKREGGLTEKLYQERRQFRGY